MSAEVVGVLRAEGGVGGGGGRAAFRLSRAVGGCSGGCDKGAWGAEGVVGEEGVAAVLLLVCSCRRSTMPVCARKQADVR